MKLKPGRWWLIYSCCYFAAQLQVHFLASASSGAATTTATSPIPNWDPSWTASCVQSTIVAVTCTLQDDSIAVVVLFSSSGSSSRKSDGDDSTTAKKLFTNDTNRNWVELEDGLRVRFHDADQVTTIDDANDTSLSRRWNLLGPSTVACMTGMVSDVDYLTRVLLKQVDTHRICYEGSRIMPTIELVQGLQQQLRLVTFYKEGRPFGIQALLIGTRGTPTQQPKLDIFSLDPSGGYRHWGSATAIGKKADIVRRHLHDSLSNREEKASLPVQEAMDVAVKALLQRDLTDGKRPDMNVPQALLIWMSKTKRTISVASIDPHSVALHVKEIVEMQTS